MSLPGFMNERLENARGITRPRTVCLMALQLLRDSSLGQGLRTIARPSWLQYPEERDDHSEIVEWYGEGDPENPLNWPSIKKAWVVFVISYYSFVVYMAAPIYSPGKDAFRHEFNVNPAESSLGLALYVLGYGAGPLLFSPLSEIPRFGRNLPYVISFTIFTILCIPKGFAPTAIGFYFLRSLQGFFGSPCLATGGASISDIYDPYVRPYAMTRLQATDGSKHYRTATELKKSHISFYDIVRESLLTPIKITLLDPAILFVNVYTSLVYAIYYTFFEAFPLAYMDIYNFNLGQMGTAFLAIIIGTTIPIIIYNIYNYLIFIPKSRSKSKSNNPQNQNPEELLAPALLACFGPSIGLFLFAWASRPEIHWIIPTLGIVIYPGWVFVLMQSVFLYIPACYPEYAASVFAAADFMRSAVACGAVVFSRPLFVNLGVGGGVLRGRSRFGGRW
ncbi:major facilitator superfamily domain-containing protein [Aspergillus transmontanensis]|uniref:Major facilitator superfamily domain-containing protein n=1 Tax=Aspergillus transmontanensis TaxID=1034304 RepID=A0A5N6VJB4_9EURO|nr:major facilitator superfamily domain-containing protein [Aspergillus transmontanensis]